MKKHKMLQNHKHLFGLQIDYASKKWTLLTENIPVQNIKIILNIPISFIKTEKFNSVKIAR